MTGGFIRRLNRLPYLFEGRFAPQVGAVDIGFADGATTRIRPTGGYVLYEVPAEHMVAGRQATSISTFDHAGVALVRAEVRDPGQVLRRSRGGP